MSKFFENHILIEVDDYITLEEENEIIDLVKRVLRRKKENRKIWSLGGFVRRDL